MIGVSPVPVAARPATSTPTQWWVLTLRVIKPTLRNGEMFTQAAASVMFTVGFYIPLKQMMGAFALGWSSYAQFLTPLIVLQAIAFAAVSAAFRSATDSVQGMNRRLRTMPIVRLTPLAARMSASLYRCSLALTVALICAHVIGFRFHGGPVHTVAFCLLALLIGAALSFLGDLIGEVSKNPEATAPLLLVPQLVFGLLSVGLQPVEGFPDWIEPFVRNQPISQFVVGLRVLASDSTPAAGAVNLSTIGPALAWAIGLILVVIPLHGFVASRRR